jgi:hypothetical protein
VPNNNLLPVDAPDLQPLRNSFEYDQLEEDLKDAFLTVFDQYIRPFERQVNLSGMPHLGETDLIERTLKDYGLAIVRRDATRTAFLLKAARARNPRRGMIFLKQYLQSVWPGVWKVEPLWYPVAKADKYPRGDAPTDASLLSPLTTVQITPTVTAEFADDSGVASAYRKDWQGRQLLYATARTNLHTYSEAVGGTGWTLANTTAAQGARVGRSNDLTMSKVTVVTQGTTAYTALQSANRPAVAANTDYTWTFDLAYGNAPTCAARMYTADHATAITSVIFNFDASGVPTVASKSAAVKAVTITPGVNGVYTVSVTFNTGAYTAISPVYYPDNASTAGNYTHFDKGQVELGATATSHIAAPAGAAVTVTDYTLDANGMATFSDGVTPPSPLLYFRTGRIRITLPVSVDNGLGLVEIAKAFRSTLAARLMLELQLSTVFESLGAASGGLSLAGGAIGCMPILAEGTLTR